MTLRLKIHPDNPQDRLVALAVEALQLGGVIAYPTDSAYALGCLVGNKGAWEQICQIRELDKYHNFTLVFQDLNNLGQYVQADNIAFRLLKAYTPGPYTFILPASSQVPRRLQHFKRKTIGIRVPDSNIAQQIVEELGEPLMSVTLIMPGEGLPLSAPDEIYERLHGKVDVFVDGGPCGYEPTSVIDFVDGAPQVVRQGKGSVEELI